MFTVRNLKAIVALLVAMITLAGAVLPERLENPAHPAHPGFGGEFAQTVGSVDQSVYRAWGEWEFSRFRMGFLYEFTRLDSLFRESFGRLELAWNGDYLSVGGAYGPGVNWIPSGEVWTRHWVELGISVRFRSLSMSAWSASFFDEEPAVLGAVAWTPSRHFMGAAVASREWVWLGEGLSFDFGSIVMGYRFPGFAVTMELKISMGNSSVRTGYFAGGGAVDEFRVGFYRSIAEKPSFDP